MLIAEYLFIIFQVHGTVFCWEISGTRPQMGQGEALKTLEGKVGIWYTGENTAWDTGIARQCARVQVLTL